VVSERARAFEVDSHEVGDRVDKCAAARLAGEGVSRGDVLRAIDNDALRVNGRAVKASYRVRAGDRVELELPLPELSEALPEDIAIDVVFEDESVLVVNKPAGLVVHPARGHASGTLVNAVLFHHAVEDDEAPERPGIVHRLDRDTSGVMVIAKTSLARERLKAQFQAHTIERVYEAIAVGVIDRALTFDTLYNRHPTERMRFSSRVREGKRACTHVTPVESFGAEATRVECRLETGRTHQIRVHLSDNGHALLGDAMYGKPAKNPRLRAIAEALGRQALHARVLGFVHPVSGDFVRFERQPPDDFARAVEALRAERR
jgi:23S rRNA pseudouridine1911/1915/1917 synthase